MTSNSIRISGALFKKAQAEGDIMSRSAAQQIEYWARLGAALETAGLTVPDACEMLGLSKSSTHVHIVSEGELWASKRAKQQRDIESVRSGKCSASSMSWFANGRAKHVKLIDSPY
jgi:hypothetical protein